MTGELWEADRDRVWYPVLRVGLLEEEDFDSEEYEMTQILIAKSFHFTIYFFFLLAFFFLAQLIAYNMETLVMCG